MKPGLPDICAIILSLAMIVILSKGTPRRARFGPMQSTAGAEVKRTSLPSSRPGPPQLSIFNAAMKASCGMSTFPNWRIFFLPAFCLSSSLRLRVASPP